MCKIVRLLPGQMLTDEQLFNAVYNNWHSYGVVIKDGKKGMDIIRNVPESGETDPKDVWKILKDSMNYERILHVRHNTAGSNDVKNCHPFDVLYLPKKKRQIVFAHNG